MKTSHSSGKKLKVSFELIYIVALILQALGVALCAASDFGVSMIVAPSYLVSMKIQSISFGQAEYLMQFLLFVLMCVLVGRFKLTYLVSIVSLLIYGAALDFWRLAIPILNPLVTAPGAASFGYPNRWFMFLCGMLIIQFTVALSFNTYLTPLVSDFFVKEVAGSLNLDRSRLKSLFDLSYLLLSIAMTLIMFGSFHAIGLGTVVQCITNGPVIGFFDRKLDQLIDSTPLLRRLYNKFV